MDAILADEGSFITQTKQKIENLSGERIHFPFAKLLSFIWYEIIGLF